MVNNSCKILESFHFDVNDLTDELRFTYQHLDKAFTNPTAFSGSNDTGNWVMSCCPIHVESRPSFGISKEAPYHCNCFYCGYLGTIDVLIEKSLDLDEGEGMKVLLSTYIFEEKHEQFDMVGYIENRRNDYMIPCLPESTLESIRQPVSNEWIYSVGMTYMHQRGFTDHTLSTYGITVDTATETIVFPQRTRTGELRFIQKRKIGSKYHGAKFINEGSPIKKDIVFGLHFINALRTTKDRIKRVRVVESPTDCMANYQVGIPAVSINGVILFKNQVSELQMAGVTEVDLMLDNDQAGQKGTEDAAKMLDRAGFVVNRVLYPNAFLKDSNELMYVGLLDSLPSINLNIIGALFK
jgi:DNA primase